MILDQHGNPFLEKEIAEPQTARLVTLQHLMIESHLDGLDPAGVARALRLADQGDITRQVQLFDDLMDRDAHLRSEYEKRQSAPLTLDWRIVPPKDASRAEKKDAAWAEEVLRDVVDDLEDVILHMQEAPGFSFAPIELEWRYVNSGGSGERIPKFHPRPQTWFQLSQDRRELRLLDGTGAGQAPVPFGWIMHTARKVKTGYLGRTGIFRPALFLFLYAAYGIGDLAEFLEVYGLPMIIGKYGQGAEAKEKSSLLRAVAALGRDARAIMPEDMKIEVMKITGSGDAAPHMTLVDWAERAKSKLVLGQTMSAEAKGGGLGSGNAELHREVRRDILASDARQLAATLTRDVLYPLLALNRPGFGSDGLRRCPRWEFDLGEAEDIKTYADAVPKLVGVGARIPQAWLHEKLRIPMPVDDEPVLAMTAAKAAPTTEPPAAAALKASQAGAAALKGNAGPDGGAAGGNEVPPDPVADHTARLAADAAPAWGEVLASVGQLVAQATSWADLEAKLMAAFDGLPDDGLVKALDLGFAAADLAGRFDVQQGR